MSYIDMKLGDLVAYQGGSWLVTSYDSVARLFTLVDKTGAKMELPRDYGEAQVVANPSKQWPVIIAPVKRGAGPFVKIQIPRISEDNLLTKELLAWVQWVPSDCGREGGPFFVHPELNILPGMLLVAVHAKGTLVRIVVPKTFGTTSHRKVLARAKKSVRSEENRFTRLSREDDEI